MTPYQTETLKIINEALDELDKTPLMALLVDNNFIKGLDK